MFPDLGPEWVEQEGLVFRRTPTLRRRLPGTTPDGRPLYQVANDLRTYREMLGVDADWKLESFHNHVHFSHRDGDEACLQSQLREAGETEAALRARFPARPFLIVVAPLDRNTVYQPAEGAPNADDLEWEPKGPLSTVVMHQRLGEPGADPVRIRAETFEAYRDRICEGCRTRWRCEDDYVRESLPGTRWSDCSHCGYPNAMAVRTLRRLVGH